MMRFMPANWSPKSWGELHASRVAMEVRRLRGGRSVQWLAERTAELGHPMNRNALTDLENGRRRYVTTAELVVLAAALDTAPATLLFSGPYNAENEVLDGTTATEFEAVQWFSGLSDAPDGIGDPEEYAENTSLLGLARRIADLQQQQIALMRLAEGGQWTGGGKAIAELQQQIDDLARETGDVLRARENTYRGGSVVYRSYTDDDGVSRLSPLDGEG